MKLVCRGGRWGNKNHRRPKFAQKLILGLLQQRLQERIYRRIQNQARPKQSLGHHRRPLHPPEQRRRA
jgi:hypothetical protein